MDPSAQARRSNPPHPQVLRSRHAGIASEPFPEAFTGHSGSLSSESYPPAPSQHHAQTQQAAAYTHTARGMSQRLILPPSNGMPSQQPFSQGQQMLTPHASVPQHQHQHHAYEQRHVPGFPALAIHQHTRRLIDSGMPTTSTSGRIQIPAQDSTRQASCSVTTNNSLTGPSHSNSGMTTTSTPNQTQQLGSSYPVVHYQDRDAVYPATHPPPNCHSYVPYPVPPTQGPPGTMPIQPQSALQGQRILLYPPYSEVRPPSFQQQQLRTTQQLAANAISIPSNASTSASDDLARFSSGSVDVVTQLADRHASAILAQSHNSLSDFLKNQRRYLRDELVLMNSKYMSNLNKIQDELRRARQAEQVSREKQENALQQCENIIAKAMKWKESLEDTRNKYKSLQDQNTKLANVALRLNKLVAAESSAASFAALQDRIAVLETKLRKYEDVPFTPIDLPSHTSFKEQGDCEAGPSPPTVCGTPFFPEKDAMEIGSRCSAAAKRRLQNEVNIVAELVERRSKPGSPKSSTEKIKGEPLTVDGKNLLSAPYFIDLTADDSDQHDILDASLSQASSSTTPIASLFTELPLDPSFPPEPDAKAIPPSVSTPPPSLSLCVDTLKRSSLTEEDHDRLRKRPRSEDTVQLHTHSGMAGAPEEALDLDDILLTRKAQESSDAQPAPVLDNVGSEVPSTSPTTEKDDVIDETMLNAASERPGKEPADNEPTPKLDHVHLQLIYHKNELGVTECRFCLLEVDNDVRDLDSRTIFPVNVTNEELVAHAVSTHCTIVISLLEVDRTKLLGAFGKMMEAI